MGGSSRHPRLLVVCFWIALNQPIVALALAFSFAPSSSIVYRRPSTFLSRLEMSYLNSLGDNDDNVEYVEELFLSENTEYIQPVDTQMMTSEEQELANVRIAALNAAARIADEAELKAENEFKVAQDAAVAEAAEAAIAMEALSQAEAEVKEAKIALENQLKVEVEEGSARLSRLKVQEEEAAILKAELMAQLKQLDAEEAAEEESLRNIDAAEVFSETASRKAWYMGLSVVDDDRYSHTFAAMTAPVALHGLWVFAVREGSSAEQAGLQSLVVSPADGGLISGERIVAIGENIMKRFEDFEFEMANYIEGTSLAIMLEDAAGERRRLVHLGIESQAPY